MFVFQYTVDKLLYEVFVNDPIDEFVNQYTNDKLFVTVLDKLLILQFKKLAVLHEILDTLMYNALEFSKKTLLILTLIILQLVIDAPVILASVIQQFVIKLFKILLLKITHGSNQQFTKLPV